MLINDLTAPSCWWVPGNPVKLRNWRAAVKATRRSIGH